jgi:two-component system CheB/CheR fusion protein
MAPSAFPIVGIGASAGGIDAFRQFFHRMPADCGMAFVVLLHLPADRKSLLTEILSRWTSMPVIEGTDGTRIEPNHVYVPPPHAIVTLANGHLRIAGPPEGGDQVFRPIDALFDSLGGLRELAVGIVLSGTGSDGALGVKAIKECGGLTIAQGSNGTAPQYGEMPAGAIATGAIDLVSPVEEMAAHLMRLKSGPVEVDRGRDEGAAVDAARLGICDILRTQLGHDFSGYRSQTFLRRVSRRMQVVNATSLEAYIEKLKASPDEVTALFRDGAPRSQRRRGIGDCETHSARGRYIGYWHARSERLHGCRAHPPRGMGKRRHVGRGHRLGSGFR